MDRKYRRGAQAPGLNSKAKPGGLTLAFLLNPAAIGVLALAYGAGLLVIPEEREASREAILILREEGVGEADA